MPYINKQPKKNKEKNLTEKQKLRAKLYNNKRWKKLRDSFLMFAPMCKKCAEMGVVNAATDVHHINSPFADGLTDVERLGRLLDPNNLMALCQQCHGHIHGENPKAKFEK